MATDRTKTSFSPQNSLPKVAERRSLQGWSLLAVLLLVSMGVGRWLRDWTSRDPSSAQVSTSHPFSANDSATGITLVNDGGDESSTVRGAATRVSEADAGRLLYETTCAKCHGSDGRGDPESLVRLQPPPRDFTGSQWRFPSTRESIAAVIRGGIPGTAMPASGQALTAGQIDLLTDHVLRLASRGAPRGELSARDARWAQLGFTLVHRAQSPDFEWERLSGAPVSSHDLQGQTVVVNVWGTTCATCLRELPAVEAFAAAHRPDGITVLSVCADEFDADSVRRALPEQLDVCFDPQGLLPQVFQITATPCCLVIDPAGYMVARRIGHVEWNDPDWLAACRSLRNDSTGPRPQN